MQLELRTEPEIELEFTILAGFQIKIRVEKRTENPAQNRAQTKG